MSRVNDQTSEKVPVLGFRLETSDEFEGAETIGPEFSAECLRLGLADEVRYSLMPILIGEGISFFDGFDQDVALHLVAVKAYKSGMVALHRDVRKQPP